jgi:hypothetical protein
MRILQEVTKQPNRLVCGLSIHLWSIGSREMRFYAQTLVDLSQEFSIEIGATVRNGLSWESMEFPNEVYKKVCDINSCGFGCGGYEMDHFCKTVYHCEDRIVSF